MLRGRTETRSMIIDPLNYEPSQRFDGWTKITVIFSCKWIVGMGKINNSFEIHHLSVWVFPRASARLANSLVSFFRVAVYLVLISNILTDGKAHQGQHNRDEEYSLDKRRHDGTWNWARSIVDMQIIGWPPVTHQLPREKRSSNVDSISRETHGNRNAETVLFYLFPWQNILQVRKYIQHGNTVFNITCSLFIH